MPDAMPKDFTGICPISSRFWAYQVIEVQQSDNRPWAVRQLLIESGYDYSEYTSFVRRHPRYTNYEGLDKFLKNARRPRYRPSANSHRVLYGSFSLIVSVWKNWGWGEPDMMRLGRAVDASSYWQDRTGDLRGLVGFTEFLKFCSTVEDYDRLMESGYYDMVQEFFDRLQPDQEEQQVARWAWYLYCTDDFASLYSAFHILSDPPDDVFHLCDCLPEVEQEPGQIRDDLVGF